MNAKAHVEFVSGHGGDILSVKRPVTERGLFVSVTSEKRQDFEEVRPATDLHALVQGLVIVLIGKGGLVEEDLVFDLGSVEGDVGLEIGSEEVPCAYFIMIACLGLQVLVDPDVPGHIVEEHQFIGQGEAEAPVVSSKKSGLSAVKPIEPCGVGILAFLDRFIQGSQRKSAQIPLVKVIVRLSCLARR